MSYSPTGSSEERAYSEELELSVRTTWSASSQENAIQSEATTRILRNELSHKLLSTSSSNPHEIFSIFETVFEWNEEENKLEPKQKYEDVIKFRASDNDKLADEVDAYEVAFQKLKQIILFSSSSVSSFSNGSSNADVDDDDAASVENGNGNNEAHEKILVSALKWYDAFNFCSQIGNLNSYREATKMHLSLVIKVILKLSSDGNNNNQINICSSVASCFEQLCQNLPSWDTFVLCDFNMHHFIADVFRWMFSPSITNDAVGKLASSLKRFGDRFPRSGESLFGPYQGKLVALLKRVSSSSPTQTTANSSPFAAVSSLVSSLTTPRVHHYGGGDGNVSSRSASLSDTFVSYPDRVESLNFSITTAFSPNTTTTNSQQDSPPPSLQDDGNSTTTVIFEEEDVAIQSTLFTVLTNLFVKNEEERRILALSDENAEALFIYAISDRASSSSSSVSKTTISILENANITYLMSPRCSDILFCAMKVATDQEIHEQERKRVPQLYNNTKIQLGNLLTVFKTLLEISSVQHLVLASLRRSSGWSKMIVSCYGKISKSGDNAEKVASTQKEIDKFIQESLTVKGVRNGGDSKASTAAHQLFWEFSEAILSDQYALERTPLTGALLRCGSLEELVDVFERDSLGGFADGVAETEFHVTELPQLVLLEKLAQLPFGDAEQITRLFEVNPNELSQLPSSKRFKQRFVDVFVFHLFTSVSPCSVVAIADMVTFFKDRIEAIHSHLEESTISILIEKFEEVLDSHHHHHHFIRQEDEVEEEQERDEQEGETEEEEEQQEEDDDVGSYNSSDETFVNFVASFCELINCLVTSVGYGCSDRKKFQQAFGTVRFHSVLQKARTICPEASPTVVETFLNIINENNAVAEHFLFGRRDRSDDDF